MLHTLSCGPGHPAVKDCVAMLRADDALLLLGDGVYIAMQHSGDGLALQQSGASLYVLDADARAAGVQQRLAACFTVVDDDGFVRLTEQHAQQMAWY
jgi:tRNA 2-thiouridine synthesizing protein B